MHISIILDGNRRFAKKLALIPWKGHDFGAEQVEKLFDWCKELGIQEVTLYALSQDNLARSKVEVSFLLDLFRKFFLSRREKFRKEVIKVRFIGRKELLPEDIQKIEKDIEEETKNNKNFKVNFCIAYSGRDEIAQAAEKLRLEGKQITKESLKQALQLQDEPDFIIRTGNAIRTSDFLPYQSIYSEWFFLEKLWPEFTKQDLIQCIEEFKARERRFGK
jgi:undecaprenyl diphosphate synthase